MSINVLYLGGDSLPVLVHCRKLLSVCFVDDCQYMARNMALINSGLEYAGEIF